MLIGDQHTPKRVPYSELVEQVRAGHVEKMEIGEQELIATLKGQER